MRIAPLAVLAAVLASPASAQTIPLPPKIAAPSGHYAIDPTHASVTMTWQHMGLEHYTARFSKIASTVDYDAADPTRSRLEATIGANSVRTDFPFREKVDFDAEIANKFLHADVHPDIRFVSRRIERTGPETGHVIGDLTLNGVTRPLTLDARFDGAIVNPLSKAVTMGISATGVVHRAEFGVTNYEPIVGDDIAFTIEAEYAKQ